MEHSEFLLAIDLLIADYLRDGCPCRYPRFRATVARDAALIGFPSFTSPEQSRLVWLFERDVPLVDRRPTRDGDHARCGVCGTTVDIVRIRFEDADKLRLVFGELALPDLGLPLAGPLPRVLDFGPVDRTPMTSGIVAAIAAAYPRMEPEAWLAWMRERA